VAKYISEHSEAKVILNGDGSDELFGGYLYMHKCPSDMAFEGEITRLLSNIYYYDVLRSDKSISSNGLEARTPFLDKSLVQYVLSVPASERNHTNLRLSEKYLLRNSFTIQNFQTSEGRAILPYDVLWRTKEAFSDGVTSANRSLFHIIQEYICSLHVFGEVADIEIEKAYYLDIFLQHFPHCESIIPEYWMPKFIKSDQNDPSARTLDCYSSTK
jgi:asparagine synthase (glutamine-hydrolysing)